MYMYMLILISVDRQCYIECINYLFCEFTMREWQLPLTNAMRNDKAALCCFLTKFSVTPEMLLLIC